MVVAAAAVDTTNETPGSTQTQTNRHTAQHTFCSSSSLLRFCCCWLHGGRCFAPRLRCFFLRWLLGFTCGGLRIYAKRDAAEPGRDTTRKLYMYTTRGRNINLHAPDSCDYRRRSDSSEQRYNKRTTDEAIGVEAAATTTTIDDGAAKAK